MEEWKLSLFLFCLLISFDFIKGNCATKSEAGRYEFGQNCDYLCRCKSANDKCDQITGECPSGCARNWMGPACQYLNIAPRTGNTMYDNDETTCTSPTSSSKDVDLGGVYPFNTVSVVFDRTRTPITICVRRVQSGNWDSCVDTIESTAGSLHAVFENIIQARYVRLEMDDFSASICEIKVTGGRNLAYKQLATQSSNFMDNGGTAMNGVDGTAGNGPYAGSEATCIKTTSEVDPWWKVHLDSLYTIVSFRIFNWLVLGCTSCSNWLVNFTLSLSNSSGAIDIVELYRDQRQTLDNEHKVTAITNITILQGRYVHVKRSGNLKAPLSFCEIQIFGDCPNNKCGLSCTENCFCKAATYVNKLNGLCYGGCQPGWRGNDLRCNEECKDGTYGQGCNKTCWHCKKGNTCNHINGSCPGEECEAGWMGSLCNQECKNGTFGQDCNKTCWHCKKGNTCNHIDGSCPGGECEAGWMGSLCNQECANGTYGDMCENNCGQCDAGPCNKVDGRCTGDECAAGFEGAYCKEKCAPGKYGNMCENDCGQCNEGSCNNVDGRCTGDKCAAGFEGDYCTQTCAPDKYGNMCENDCGQCDAGHCSNIDGRCPDGRCAAGFKGTKCTQNCNSGTYGVNCASSCGRCKDNDTCDPQTGVCTSGCEDGWNTNNCDVKSDEEPKIPPTQSTSVAAIAGGIVASVLVVVCGIIAFIFFRRRKHLCEDTTYEETHPTTDEHLYNEIGNLQRTTGEEKEEHIDTAKAEGKLYKNIAFTTENEDKSEYQKAILEERLRQLELQKRQLELQKQTIVTNTEDVEQQLQLTKDAIQNL